MANQPMLPKSHTNSADFTSRLPDGRSTKDWVKLAGNEQTLKRMAAPRSALRAPVLYHRPIGRCFTTGLVKGSHHIYRHPDFKRSIPVPHPRKDLKKGTLEAIRKQAGLK